MEDLNKALENIENTFINKLKEHEVQVAESGKASAKTSEDLKAISNDFEAMTKEVKDLQASLIDFQQKSVSNAQATSKKSIGNQFVENDSYSNFLNGTSTKASMFQNNTILTTAGGTQTREDKGIIVPSLQPLTLLDVVSKATTNATTVHYVKEATSTNAAAPQTEGAVKAESTITFSEVTETVRSVAHFLKMSKQSLEDAPFVSSWADTRLGHGVREEIVNQIINGDGTGNNFSGLRATGNFTTTVVSGLSTIADAANKMKVEMEVAGYMPAYFLMNPADFGTLETDKGTDGHYVKPLIDVNGVPYLWGVPVVKSHKVAANDFMLVGQDACVLVDREQTNIAMSESDEDNFQSNLVTIRAEARACAITPYAAGIRYSDLSTLV